jgi:hypothetical protein
MQKIILFFIFLFGVLGVACKQMPSRTDAVNKTNSDFSEYFIMTQKAYMAMQKKDYNGALSTYKKAFKKVATPFHTSYRNDYFEVAKCYYTLKDSIKAVKFVLKSAELGFLYSNLKTTFSPTFLAKIELIYNKKYKDWEVGLDTNMINKVKKVRDSDQYFRNMITSDMQEKTIDSLMKLQQKIDNVNFKYLDSLLVNSQYPSFSTIGELYLDLAMLFFHLDLQTLDKHKNSIKMLIKRGTLHPNIFAHAYDYALVNLGKPQLYGFEAEFDLSTKKLYLHTPIQDSLNLDNRRQDIYLYPYENHIFNLSQNGGPNLNR